MREVIPDDPETTKEFSAENERAAYREMSLSMLANVLRNRVGWLENLKANPRSSLDDGTCEWVGMLATCLLTCREELATYCEGQLGEAAV
jgi:hypothetical protein